MAHSIGSVQNMSLPLPPRLDLSDNITRVTYSQWLGLGLGHLILITTTIITRDLYLYK